MGVTNSPLPRDDKRDSERESGQASAPSVHCFGSAKQREENSSSSLFVNVVNERLSGVDTIETIDTLMLRYDSPAL